MVERQARVTREGRDHLAAGFGSTGHPLVVKLETLFALSDAEKEALQALPMQVAEFAADQDIVREGDRPGQSCTLLDGFACTYKMTGAGKRQILSFYYRGDIPDLQSLHLGAMDNSLSTITACRVGLIPHLALRDLCARHPRIAAAFWRETLADAAMFREWILNVGRRDSRSRVAHVLCEQVVRMRAIGLTQDHTCDLPLTQVALADAVGLSIVHVNRMLQELRGAGLISWNGARLVVLDWDRLRAEADFDPAYLHLRSGRAVA